MTTFNAIEQNEGAVAAATSWIAQGLVGPTATSIGVFAIAALGFSMLWGRFDLRLAGRTVLGTFILFGAPLIASELMNTLHDRDQPPPDTAQTNLGAELHPILKNAPVNDPYAGAAVPQLQ